MLMWTLAVLAQIEPHDKAIETGRKEGKPVLCFIHRNDWAGEEKTGKGLREALGDLAGKVVLAHANLQKEEALVGSWKMKRLDSALIVLDPMPTRAADQPIARFEKDEGQLTPANLKAFVEEALKAWAEFAAARKAFDVFWAACMKPDFEAFKASLWPAQARDLGDEILKKTFDSLAEVMKKRERAYHAGISREEAKDRRKAIDPAIEAVYRVGFVMVDKDGKEDGSSLRVVRTGGKYSVEWER